MIEKEIDKSTLMDFIEYELNWRKRARQAEIEEINKEILAKEKELQKKKEENAKLKSILIENGIPF